MLWRLRQLHRSRLRWLLWRTWLRLNLPLLRQRHSGWFAGRDRSIHIDAFHENVFPAMRALDILEKHVRVYRENLPACRTLSCAYCHKTPFRPFTVLNEAGSRKGRKEKRASICALLRALRKPAGMHERSAPTARVFATCVSSVKNSQVCSNANILQKMRKSNCQLVSA